MKKTVLAILALFLTVCCTAQQKLAFPFQGGKSVMRDFFKENLTVSPEIIQEKATGTVIFKFTADQKGVITKVVVYYADDAILVPPIIEALKKSDHKWVIPDHEKFNDFIILFSYSFTAPASETREMQKAAYKYASNRKPIFSTDQIPLDMATLLPAIVVKYDIEQ